MKSDSIHEIITAKEVNVSPTSLLSLLSSDKFSEINKFAIKSQIDQLLDIQQNVFNNKAPMESLITEGLDFNQIFEQYNIILQVLSPKMLKDLKDLSSVLTGNDDEEEGEEDEEEGEEDEEEGEEDEEEGEEDEEAGEEDEEYNEEIDSSDEEDIEEPPEEAAEKQQAIALNNADKIEGNNTSFEEEFHSAMEEDILSSSDGETENKDEDKDVFFDAQALLDKLDDADEKGLDILINNDDSEDIDFFADVPSEEDEEADYFNDFFDPPENRKQQSKNNGKKSKETTLFNEEVEEAMSNVRKDLFSDDEDHVEDSEELGSNQTSKILSSHERQQLEITRQIEQLESKSVEDKHWGMKGESTARARPKDSLVDTEVELEFESNAKSVPVMTAEAIESIEEIIKRRIKNAEFDDLQRRIINNSMRKRREREEVSQIKSKQSLAEQYKQEDNDAHAGTTNAEFEESDEIKSKHNELDILFNDVMYTLNALSSAHFTPKPISKDLEVRVETSTITMEDQQPLVQNAESSLAPQEIYKNTGKEKLNENEVVLKNGLSISKEEMSKEEKQKLRRSIKRKRSKSMKEKDARGLNKKNKIDESIGVLTSNSKHITVIGKDGKSTDSKGNAKHKTNGSESIDSKFTGNYKL